MARQLDRRLQAGALESDPSELVKTVDALLRIKALLSRRPPSELATWARPGSPNEVLIDDIEPFGAEEEWRRLRSRALAQLASGTGGSRQREPNGSNAAAASRLVRRALELDSALSSGALDQHPRRVVAAVDELFRIRDALARMPVTDLAEWRVAGSPMDTDVTDISPFGQVDAWPGLRARALNALSARNRPSRQADSNSTPAANGGSPTEADRGGSDPSDLDGMELNIGGLQRPKPPVRGLSAEARRTALADTLDDATLEVAPWIADAEALLAVELEAWPAPRWRWSASPP